MTYICFIIYIYFDLYFQHANVGHLQRRTQKEKILQKNAILCFRAV